MVTITKIVSVDIRLSVIATTTVSRGFVGDQNARFRCLVDAPTHAFIRPRVDCVLTAIASVLGLKRFLPFPKYREALNDP